MGRCRLRMTEVDVAGLGVVRVRALPMSPRVVGLIERGLTPGTLLELVRIGIGYDQTEEEVEELLEAGLVPLSPGPDDGHFAELLEAMGVPTQMARGFLDEEGGGE
jgi:hypothetical protein